MATMDVTINLSELGGGEITFTLDASTTGSAMKNFICEELGVDKDMFDIDFCGELIQNGILTETGIQPGSELVVVPSKKCRALKRLGKEPTKKDFLAEVLRDGDNIADYINAGLDPNVTYSRDRHFVVRGGNILFAFPPPKATKELLTLGVDPHHTVEFQRCKGDPYIAGDTTALRCAAGHGKFDFIKAMMSMGISTSSDVDSVLHIACGSPRFGGGNFVRRLIEDLKMDATHKLPDSDGSTPLDWAVCRHNGDHESVKKVVEVLKEFGAKPTTTTISRIRELSVWHVMADVFPELQEQFQSVFKNVGEPQPCCQPSFSLFANIAPPQPNVHQGPSLMQPQHYRAVNVQPTVQQPSPFGGIVPQPNVQQPQSFGSISPQPNVQPPQSFGSISPQPNVQHYNTAVPQSNALPIVQQPSPFGGIVPQPNVQPRPHILQPQPNVHPFGNIAPQPNVNQQSQPHLFGNIAPQQSHAPNMRYSS